MIIVYMIFYHTNLDNFTLENFRVKNWEVDNSYYNQKHPQKKKDMIKFMTVILCYYGIYNF